MNDTKGTLDTMSDLLLLTVPAYCVATVATIKRTSHAQLKSDDDDYRSNAAILVGELSTVYGRKQANLEVSHCYII